MSAYFITSCGTDIGKTFVMTTLCWNLCKIGQTVHAVKPVVSGWDNSDVLNNDTCKILCSLSIDCNDDNIIRTSPWRLYNPYAPNIAAKLENVELDYNKILAFCYQCARQPYDCVLIEGVGGIMSPIANTKTCLDLVRDLNIKVILVIGAYLGSISHTLTALEVLSNVDVKVILSVKNNDTVNINNIVEFIYKYTGKLVYIQSHIKGSSNLWKNTSSDIVDFILK